MNIATGKLILLTWIAMMAVGAQAATNTWDNDSLDGLWTTATNWSLDVAPAAGDTLNISNGDTVDFNAGDQNLPAGCTINLTSNSVLSEDVVIRFNGSAVNVASGSSLVGGFWDLNNGTLVFEDGAVATMANWEHKGTNAFRFNLGASGFTTLQPGTLWLGGATMSNATYIVDLANFTGGVDVVDLVDFSGNNGGVTADNFQWANQVFTNMGTYTNAVLGFEAGDIIIKLYLDGLPDPDLVTWDGGGGDNSWTTAANWDPDQVPDAGNNVVVGLSASVTNGQNDFALLSIESGASVTFVENTSSASPVSNAGTLNFAGVFRLSGAPEVTLTGTGSFGSDMTWLDTQGATINFHDGASIGNPGMSLEHRVGNTFGYTLSETGFTTLNFGTLWDGGSTWSDATYNIDVSSYDYSNGTTIVLADFSSHLSPFDGTFDPTVNIIATNGLGGSVLSFDTTLSRLVLTIDPPGNDPPVAQDQTISVTTNGPTAFTLLATDVEGSNLTYSIVTEPTNGLLSGTAPALTYTITNSPFLFDSFTFTAMDESEVSNTGTVTIARIPDTDNELWSTYHDVILNDALNTEWLTNWVEDGISIWQVRYDLGDLAGTRTNASPKIAAFYAYPEGGTNLPGLVQIHGGGQRALSSMAKLWAEQGYASISINWGALPLIDGQPNTDWDGLPSGFLREGVTNAIFHNWCDPDVYNDGATLYDVPHPLNSSWIHNSYAGRRALTFLTDQPRVDSNKLGVVGWSMGGRTTSLVATDPRLTAVGPGVGGTGFLYEDWWGLPGTARSTNGVEDVELYKRTTASQSYWPDVTAPTLYLEAANDFNAPFDLVIKALSLQDTNVPQRLAVSPHFNHRNWPDAEASRVLWMRTQLAGTFDFPETSPAILDLSNPDGIPRFRVWPDTSTAHPIVSVDIYYGIERDSRLRFWRDTVAVETNGYWEAECPVYDLGEMLAAMAIVKYDPGFAVPLFAGQSTNFSVVSDVHLVYPPDLANNGVQEAEVKERLIDDFALGYKDWWYLNENNSQLWQFWSRKLGDPSWRGPAGGELALDVVTTAGGNTLGIQLDTTQWNSTDATTFKATATVSATGSNGVSLSVSAFTNGLGVALTTWSDVKHIGLLPGNMIDGGLPAWSGAVPTFSNLRWESGNYLPGEEFARWMASFGPRGTNAAIDADVEGDGFYNLFEYGVGSSPISGAIDGLPTIGNTDGNGFQGLEYVYRRRLDAAARGLSYTVQSDTNLIISTWNTNGTEELGSAVIDFDFEMVTNRISGGDLAFGRLKVIMVE